MDKKERQDQLDETIRLSREELQELSQRTRRSRFDLDEDYFDRQYSQVQEVEKNIKLDISQVDADDSSKGVEEVFEEDLLSDFDFEEFDGENTSSEDEEFTEEDAHDEDENSFTYKPITEKLKRQALEEKTAKPSWWETTKLKLSSLISSDKKDHDEEYDEFDDEFDKFYEDEVEEDLVEEVSNEEVTEKMYSSDNLVEGTAWLSFGKIFSRIIGALYIIPWSTWFGESYQEANALYSVGYKPYSLFLSIATAGFPSAISKQMALYNSKGEYRAADKLFKNTAIIMGATGLVSALLLYILAPTMANASSIGDPRSGALVIRSLAPALLILPLMSLLRGYFQGYNYMRPTGVSEVLEQVARVVYLLVATYAVMKLSTGDVTKAVAHSTFAAFVGALIALIYLIVIYIKRRPAIDELIEQSKDEVELDFKQSLKIMVSDSLPFIILGSGIIIAQNIDTYTFSAILSRTSTLTRAEISALYGTYSLDVDKLIMIVISIAVALSTAFVPAVTSSFSKYDFVGTSKLISKIMKVFTFFIFPASMGMAGISNNLYEFFYSQGNENGPHLLRISCVMCVVLALYTILSTLLQALNFKKEAVMYLLIGLLLKVVLQYPLMALFEVDGACYATTISFLITCVLMWRKIHLTFIIDYKDLNKMTMQTLISSIVMVISTIGWSMLLDGLGPVGRLLTLVKIVVVVLISAFIYIVMMGFFGQWGTIIGDRYKELQDQLRVW